MTHSCSTRTKSLGITCLIALMLLFDYATRDGETPVKYGKEGKESFNSLPIKVQSPHEPPGGKLTQPPVKQTFVEGRPGRKQNSINHKENAFNLGTKRPNKETVVLNTLSKPVGKYRCNNLISVDGKHILAPSSGRWSTQFQAILLYDTVQWFRDKQVADKDVCGYCPFVRDRAKLSDKDTFAVLFHFRRYPQTPPPKDPKRRSDQLYLWWALESPGNTVVDDQRNFQRYNYNEFGPNYLNGTMTFRLDSLFVLPGYQPGSVNPVEVVKTGWNGIEVDVSRLLKNKAKHGVALISNCVLGGLARTRIKVVQEIQKKGYPIDTFGKCFSHQLPDFNKPNPRLFRTLEKYKFYFAFENSLHCRDYITEKFFINGLAAGAVPVVFGPKRASYEAVAPHHSFIHVEDFETLKDLVKHLKYLESNETAYAEYFAWRKAPVEASYPYGKHIGFCALCRALYGIALDDKRPFNEIYGPSGIKYDPATPLHFSKPQTVDNLRKWWQVDESKECLSKDEAEKMKFWDDVDPIGKT